MSWIHNTMYTQAQFVCTTIDRNENLTITTYLATFSLKWRLICSPLWALRRSTSNFCVNNSWSTLPDWRIPFMTSNAIIMPILFALRLYPFIMVNTHTQIRTNVWINKYEENSNSNWNPKSRFLFAQKTNSIWWIVKLSKTQIQSSADRPDR